MYFKTETTPEIIMSRSKCVVNPIATLKDTYDGVCQIINDDHCYVVCLKQPDGTYIHSTHIFKEVLDVLKNLPSPI
jgi:hypothetical protein